MATKADRLSLHINKTMRNEVCGNAWLSRSNMNMLFTDAQTLGCLNEHDRLCCTCSFDATCQPRLYREYPWTIKGVPSLFESVL